MNKKGEVEKKYDIHNKTSSQESKVKAFLNDIKNNSYNNLNHIDIVLDQLSKNERIFTQGDQLNRPSKTLSSKNHELINKKGEIKKKNSNKNLIQQNTIIDKKLENSKNKKRNSNTFNTSLSNNDNYRNSKNSEFEKKTKQNSESISNVNNTFNSNLDDLPENSNINLNLNPLPNITDKDEDNLSPIIRNKNISEFLSNNKLIATDFKSNKKSRETKENINDNNQTDKILYNNNHSNHEEENLETPKIKKAKHNVNEKQDNLKPKINQNQQKSTMPTNTENGIFKKINVSNNNHSKVKHYNNHNCNINMSNITNSNKSNNFNKSESFSNLNSQFNSEKNKLENKYEPNVIFTLSKINEPVNNQIQISKGFEVFDSNDLENYKEKMPLQKNSKEENDEIIKTFNFNNSEFFSNENDISKKSNYKTLTNYYNSNDYFNGTPIKEDENYENNMIIMKTESDELNRSNDFKEKINELNLSMKLKKSASLNFIVNSKKTSLKGSEAFRKSISKKTSNDDIVDKKFSSDNKLVLINSANDHNIYKTNLDFPMVSAGNYKSINNNVKFDIANHNNKMEYVNQSKKNSTKDLNMKLNTSIQSKNRRSSHNPFNHLNGNYTYHNSSYIKDENSLNRTENEIKTFDTAEIMLLINNAQKLEKVLSDDAPLYKIEEFEKKLQANAKLIENLQTNSAGILHDKMEIDIKIKELKGLVNQFNDRFVKIDKFLDKGKLKINQNFNKNTFDQKEYLNSFYGVQSEPFNSLKKSFEKAKSKEKEIKEHKLNKTFHTKSKYYKNKIIELNSTKKGRKSAQDLKEIRNKSKNSEKNIGQKEKNVMKEKEENFDYSNVEKPSIMETQERNQTSQRNKAKNKYNNGDYGNTQENLEYKKIEKIPFTELESNIHCVKSNPISNSKNSKPFIFSKEDEEELENLENEIEKIDFEIKSNKNNKGKLNVKNENINNGNAKESNNEKKVSSPSKSNKNDHLHNNNNNTLESNNHNKKNYKKIEVNKLLTTKINRNNASQINRKFSNDSAEDEIKEYKHENSRTERSKIRSTKYDSDFNNVKANNNTTIDSQKINNLTKIQKILRDLETIKNRSINVNDNSLGNNLKTGEANNKNFNNLNNTSMKNSRFYISNFNSEEDLDSEEECDSHNKTYYKTNKSYIDLDNSKMINKFFKEEKISEAIDIWKRFDYGRFDGMSLERSYEMMTQITKIKDKDIEFLLKKLVKFKKLQKENKMKDTEIIELVAEVESLKYKIQEMENKIGNSKIFENKMEDLDKQNSFLFKENIKLRTLLEQERYFNSYKNQPNFMKK